MTSPETQANGHARAQPQAHLREQAGRSAQRVPLATLQRRGYRNVRVLGRRDLDRLVSEAVERALGERGARVDAPEQAAMERRVGEEMARLSARATRMNTERDDESKRREALEAEVERLREALEHQRAEADRQRARADGVTRSGRRRSGTATPGDGIDADLALDASAVDGDGAGAADVEIDEATLARLEVRLRERIHGWAHGLAGEGKLAAAALDGSLDALVDGVLEDVGAHMRESAWAYERRLAKLTSALTRTEQALALLARTKGLDAGLASIYEVIQGLSLEDPGFEKKTALLREVFEQNLDLQDRQADDDPDARDDAAPPPPSGPHPHPRPRLLEPRRPFLNPAAVHERAAF